MKTKKEENFSSSELVGQRIRKCRTHKGFSQAELARLAGYRGAASVSELESGHTAGAPFEVLGKLAEALEVDLHWLITGKPGPSTRQVADLLMPVSMEYAAWLWELQAELQQASEPDANEISLARKRVARVLSACNKVVELTGGGLQHWVFIHPATTDQIAKPQKKSQESSD